MAEFGLDPDPALIPIYDPLADGQPNTGPGILIVGVQSFEKAEDCFPELGGDTDARVPDREDPLAILVHRADMHFRAPVRIAVLEGVANEVLEQLLQMRAMNA